MAGLEPEDVPTVDECLKNAARLYRNAEMDTDLNKMQRVEALGDSWCMMATLIVQWKRGEA